MVLCSRWISLSGKNARRRKHIGAALLFSGLLLLGGPVVAFSWQWPIHRVEIIHGFGGNAGDGFRVSDFLLGNDTAVHPIAAGKVVFAYERGGRPGGIPSPLGNFVVVQHQNGFRSVYGNLSSIPGKPGDSVSVTSGSVIGHSGESGYAEQSGLSLRIVDMKRDRMVNPLAVLPTVPDALDPVVHGLFVKRKSEVPFLDGLVVRPGRIRFVANIADQGQGVNSPAPVAPYGVELWLDGKQITHVELEDLRLADGELFLDAHHRWNFGSVYLGRYVYNLGETDLRPGVYRVQIRTFDFSGNETVIDKQLRVQPPPPAKPASVAGKRP